MSEQLHELSRRFLAAQLSGNRTEALRLVVDEGLGAGLHLTDVHLGIIRPAQYEIGRLWHENVLSVAQEHLATAIAQLALSHLYRFLPRGPSNGRRVVVACVEGEQHELGARMVADLLEIEGFDVWYLSPNTPAQSLTDLVRSRPPDLVALSATMTFHFDALERTVRALQRAVATPLPVLVGGQAIAHAPALVSRLGVHLLDADARHVAQRALDLARRSPASTAASPAVGISP